TNLSVSIPMNGSSKFFRLISPSLRILSQPAGRAANIPSTVVLSVDAMGVPPLSYHWRLNGVLLPDQTNSTLMFDLTSVDQYGLYEAIVEDATTLALSAPAVIRPGGAETILSDSFAGRPLFTDLDASIHGNTFGATSEAGEPLHA